MSRLSLIIIIVIFVACKKPISTINEWRGPNRSGIYQESNLLKSWPENGPKLIWETNELGYGYGSPTITNDKLFVVGTIDSSSVLFAFGLDGELLFKSTIGNEWVLNYPGSRCAPTVAGDLVYVMTGKGDLSCVDGISGKLVWQKNMIIDFGGESPRFGFSESIVVDGDNVFCCPGGPKDNVVALNRFSGDRLWSCEGKGERSAYHSPKMISCGTRKIIITFSAYHLLAIDEATGQLLWTHEQVNTPADKREPGMGDTHANTILFDNNILYYAEGDGNCAVALQLNADGTSIKQLWNNAMVDNYMGGIVKIDNYIYSCAFSKNDLVKVDARKGSIIDSLSVGRGTLIAADKMLYYYNTKGEVHLVDIHGDEMKAVSNFKITKGKNEHFAHPVIHKGVLYIRHGEYLGAYSILK